MLLEETDDFTLRMGQAPPVREKKPVPRHVGKEQRMKDGMADTERRRIAKMRAQEEHDIREDIKAERTVTFTRRGSAELVPGLGLSERDKQVGLLFLNFYEEGWMVFNFFCGGVTVFCIV